MRIARMKRDVMLAYTMKAAVKEVLGACVTLGVTAEGMDPRECQKAIDEGKFDDVLMTEA
jgi:large subunit ribosomal protein L11